jgi:PASTA domain
VAYSRQTVYTEEGVERKGLRSPSWIARRANLWPLSVALLMGSLGGAVLSDLSHLETTSAEPRGTVRTVGPAPTSQLTVPPVSGLTAAQARQVLVRAGLVLDDLVAARAEPGRVVSSVPAQGHPVAPGTAVTLLVGVEQQRFRLEIRTQT